MPLLDAEIKSLNVTHAVVGAWLSDNWNLPAAVSETIQYHHTPTDKNSRLVSLIHISDFMVSRNFFSVTGRDPAYRLEPQALAVLGIAETDLLEIEADVDRDMFSDSTLDV
jgi:HD-like signal output (HDOD) protein